jgi:endonuclease/exonuclease/phosphatase (EEP) superfamily protein YafD
MILPIMLLLAFFHKVRNMLIYFAFIILGTFYLYYLNQPFIAKTMDKEKTNTLKHIQFNLNFRNQKMDEVINYLKQSNADVITLQEVTKKHQEALSKMLKEYPSQAYCEFYPVVGAVAILSKHPFSNEKSACLKNKGLQWSQIMVNKKPINIVSIHTYWPFPYEQAQQIQDIKAIFKHIKGLTLIAGDFNAVSWSHTVKQIEETSNTKVVNGLRWTIELKKQIPLIPNFKLPIDHVLLSKEFQVEEIFVEKDLGSDHFAVVTKIRY